MCGRRRTACFYCPVFVTSGMLFGALTGCSISSPQSAPSATGRVKPAGNEQLPGREDAAQVRQETAGGARPRAGVRRNLNALLEPIRKKHDVPALAAVVLQGRETRAPEQSGYANTARRRRSGPATGFISARAPKR